MGLAEILISNSFVTQNAKSHRWSLVVGRWSLGAMPGTPKARMPNFHIDEVVWAKCGSYPWWPAQVRPQPLNAAMRGRTLLVHLACHARRRQAAPYPSLCARTSMRTGGPWPHAHRPPARYGPVAAQLRYYNSM